MIYTCSCCKHIEYRELIGGNAYYCTAHDDYMYPASAQCEDFELKPQITRETINKPDGNCLDCEFQYLKDSDYWCSICPGNPEDI